MHENRNGGGNANEEEAHHHMVPTVIALNIHFLIAQMNHLHSSRHLCLSRPIYGVEMARRPASKWFSP